jgi:integration host factor subunit alpha
VQKGAPMTNGTLTRADLTEAIYRSLGISRNDAADFVERILEEMAATLEKGENVKISSFGTFSVRDKKLRMGRNPKTGEEVPITPRRVVTFRASHVLKDEINEGLAGKSAAAAE